MPDVIGSRNLSQYEIVQCLIPMKPLTGAPQRLRRASKEVHIRDPVPCQSGPSNARSRQGGF
jgi:hypothetical protein